MITQIPITEEITGDMYETREGKDGKAIFIYSPMTTHGAAEGVLQPVTYNETLYYFNKKTGLYEVNKGVVETWLQTQFDELILNDILPTSTTLKPKITEIIFRLIHTNPIPKDEYPFNQYNGIPVNNGVLVYKEGTFSLIPYEEEMMFTRKIPVNFNPEANTENIKQILMDWLEEDYPYLIQIPAQALYQALPEVQPMKKAYMLVGESNAAKSTYLDLLRDFFGERYCSKVPLQNLGARFSKADLVNKFVNLGDDLPDIDIGAFNILKDITGGRTHQVELKHKDAFTADITAVHVYAANKPPGLSEKIETDNAWWDRWVFLRFRNTFPKKANWYKENIIPNLEGYLLLVLEELSRIIENGGQLQYIQPMEDVLDMWKRDSDPLLRFLDEETDSGKDLYIQKDELFAALGKWSDNISDKLERVDIEKRLPKTKEALSRKLIQYNIQASTAGSGKNKIQVYRGIGWKKYSQFRPRETVNSRL